MSWKKTLKVLWDESIDLPLLLGMPNYKFNKSVFRAVIVVLLIMLIVTIYVDGFSGEIVYNFDTGEKFDDRSALSKYFVIWTFLLVFIGFVVNHYMYNKGDVL